MSYDCTAGGLRISLTLVLYHVDFPIKAHKITSYCPQLKGKGGEES